MKDTTITAITKSLRLCVLAGLLVLIFVCSASAQDDSMIPDDFDWGVYLQTWEESDDGWWTVSTQQDYTWQEPIVYDWYGETSTIDFWQPTAVPQDTYSWDSYTVPVYSQETWDFASQYGGYVDENGDVWFSQITEDFFDDFDSWDRTEIPDSAYVSGFVGYQQSYNLDCEARSAVDLANYFGVSISHSEFLNSLPKSDDPDAGFVGYFNDARGHIPPASYGVYQEPVAALLRRYGLNAVGAYAYTQDALKRQIANGRPVMVWVVGNTEVGYSVPYTAASTGRTTYVAPYQHTVVVTGYDANNVIIQDGGMRYSRDWSTFLVSWGALGNRAIYVN